MIPILEAKRLMLVTHLPDYFDLCLIIEWLNDKKVVKYSEQRHKTHTLGTEFAYIESFHPPSEFRLIRKHHAIVGTITAHVDVNNKVADMGILIGPEFWKHGYGYEAWQAMMDHLFNEGIRKVEAGCMSENAGMKKIFMKSGMHKEGIRTNHFLLDGVAVDMELWGRSNGNR